MVGGDETFARLTTNSKLWQCTFADHALVVFVLVATTTQQQINTCLMYSLVLILIARKYGCCQPVSFSISIILMLTNLAYQPDQTTKVFNAKTDYSNFAHM